MIVFRDPWWKLLPHPCFHLGFREPCPYIWFAYWLITWDREPGDRARVSNISISFMPD